MQRGGTSTAGADEATRPARARSPFTTELVRGREPFLRLRAGWDAALLAGPDPTPALEHDFLRLWVEAFAASQEPLVLTAQRAGRLSTALPLLFSASTVDGVPVRLAQSLGDAHATRGGLLVGPEGLDAVPALVERLAQEPWDALFLRDVPQEAGVLDRLVRALAEAGLATHLESPMDSPYVPLPGSYPELEERLDARLKQNLRRRRRRLEEQGPVSFELFTSADGLDQALEEAFDIEASGWKGREGSSIRDRPQTVGFYAAFARALARSGRLRLSFLKVGDERIAFQLGHVTRGRYYLPKTGYRETYRAESPGQLLTSEVLRRCIDERLETLEFLGHAMPWKRDWSPLVRPHASVWAFRRSWRGRAAELVRCQLRPRLAAGWKRVQAQLSRGSKP